MELTEKEVEKQKQEFKAKMAAMLKSQSPDKSGKANFIGLLKSNANENVDDNKEKTMVNE